MVGRSSISLSAAIFALGGAAAALPEVKLHAGTVSGGYCADTGVKLFQGIPYAKPPVNELRFMAPQPFEGSYPGGHLNATTPPAACIQFDGSATGAPPSEDWYVTKNLRKNMNCCRERQLT